MRLTSEPKAVNFRLVLNKTEITSLEELQQHFDFRLLSDDKNLLVSWLNKKFNGKGDAVENAAKDQNGINAISLINILNIIYDKTFDNIYQFLDYWYEAGNNKYEKPYNSFIKCLIKDDFNITKDVFQPEKILYHLKDESISRFISAFSNENVINSNEYISWALSWVYYIQGDYSKSRAMCPNSYVLTEDERKLIMNLSTGALSEINILNSTKDKSIIGTEFIFLCLIGLKRLKSEIIDSNEFVQLKKHLRNQWEFLHLFQSISKSHKIDNQIKQLGYNAPTNFDPLKYEKTFLASCFVEKEEKARMLEDMMNDYFPAAFCLEEDNDNISSVVLKDNDEYVYDRWFEHVIEYHDSPTGLDGDRMNRIRLDVLLCHFFKEEPELMEQNFCLPMLIMYDDDLDTHIKQNILNLKVYYFRNPDKRPGMQYLRLPELNEQEKPYLTFFKNVVKNCLFVNDNISARDIIDDWWNRYDAKYDLAIRALNKIHEYDTLYVEKSFIIGLLYYSMGDLRYNQVFKNPSVNRYEPTSQFLYKTYEPHYTILGGNEIWKQRSSMANDNRGYKTKKVQKMIRRWIANFIYYINVNNE